MNLIEIEVPKYMEDLQLPDPALLNYYRDLEKRVIWVDFEIGDQLIDVCKNIMRFNAEDAAAGLAPEDRKPIKIFLYSYGGVVDAMFQFIDICELSKTPIITINAGVCYSAAMLMLIAGHKRYAMKHSNGMIHHGSGGFVGDYDKMKDNMENHEKIVKQMQEYILAHTEIPKAVYGRKSKSDWYLSAGDMLEYKVVDGIIDDLDTIL